MKADAVFEGGGIKGLAFAGAVMEMEERGYEWQRLAGTSAGAITASLLAAGYTGKELWDVFYEYDFTNLIKRTGVGKLPLIGHMASVLLYKGVYPSDPVEWMIDEFLRKKGIRTFGDLPADKLKLIASDITGGRMLILPDDLKDFGIDPNYFPIARAVRMSASIPYYFQPTLIYDKKTPYMIVDGALLSNFPVWLFDVPTTPRWPTFGFRLSGEGYTKPPAKILGMYSYTRELITTLLEAHDRFFIKKSSAIRTIFIPTLGVKLVDFGLDKAARDALWKSGREAAGKFLDHWDFEAYVKEYRQME
ncbi:patatin-like phospholipase family protein [Brevibacillus dissolubilis]|uniref:patatin-like phospholipase family protein n=1 Tax=Brevibacillus dissolubilis TaxID=1844116 RepID=UPI00111721D9|nr:patatin-like phospholipase family protein [Brevibacillus dissolubilis]